MEHITNVLVYSNRCEVLDSHVFTVGDRGFPHIRLKFLYMFGAETLLGKELELKYILPDKTYQMEKITVSGKDEVLFPIHYSVFVNGGWTTLKVTIVEGANRITLDDITIKTKKLEVGEEFQHEEVKAIVKTEITKISKKIKEFEEETKTELNNLKTNLSKNLENEKNDSIAALKEAYKEELKKLDTEVKKSVTKYLENNTNDFNEKLDKKENAFSKNTAFNKDFGIIEDTVLEGNKFTQMMGKDYGGILNIAGQKEAGKAYWDNNTKKLYICKNNNSDISSNETNYIPFDNGSILERLENLFNVKTYTYNNTNDINADAYIHYTATKIMNICILEIKFARPAAKDVLIPSQDMPVEFRPKKTKIFAATTPTEATKMSYHWLRLTSDGKFYTHNTAASTIKNLQTTIAYETIN